MKLPNSHQDLWWHTIYSTYVLTTHGLVRQSEAFDKSRNKLKATLLFYKKLIVINEIEDKIVVIYWSPLTYPCCQLLNILHLLIKCVIFDVITNSKILKSQAINSLAFDFQMILDFLFLLMSFIVHDFNCEGNTVNLVELLIIYTINYIQYTIISFFASRPRFMIDFGIVIFTTIFTLLFVDNLVISTAIIGTLRSKFGIEFTRN